MALKAIVGPFISRHRDVFVNVVALFGFVFLMLYWVGSAIQFLEQDHARAMAQVAAARAANQKWSAECLAAGGYVQQSSWVEEIPFRKKAQRYVTHYRHDCLKPADATFKDRPPNK